MEDNTPQAPAIQNIDQEDQDLQFTRNVREMIIKQIIKDPTNIPVDDPKTMGVLTQMLNGMDQASLTKKRIKSEERINDKNAGAAAVVAGILSRIGAIRAEEPPVIDITPRPAPTLGDEIPKPALVPGEIEVDAAQGSFEEFTKRMMPQQDDAM